MSVPELVDPSSLLDLFLFSGHLKVFLSLQILEMTLPNCQELFSPLFGLLCQFLGSELFELQSVNSVLDGFDLLLVFRFSVALVEHREAVEMDPTLAVHLDLLTVFIYLESMKMGF